MRETAKVFEFSPSAIKTWRRCNMSWGFTYIHGLRGPQGAGAALGTRIHKEMEDWLEDFVPPNHAAAKRLVPLAPHPNHPGLLIENSFRNLYPVGDPPTPAAGKGFIDLIVPEPDLKYLPRDGGFKTNVPIVFDWKSTARLDTALEPDQLLQDPQGVLYGVAARLEVSDSIRSVPEVDLVWVYTGTKVASAFPVKARQTLTILEDAIVPILDSASDMKRAKTDGSVSDLDYDLRACETGFRCPHRSYCPAYTGYHRIAPEPIPAPDPTLKQENAVDLLEKLKQLSNSPMAPAPAPLPQSEPDAEPTFEAATETNRVKPSTEPSIPFPSIEGTRVPPPSPILVVPPDAPANLTPETAAQYGTEIVPKPPKAEKPRRGRPKKAVVELESDPTVTDGAPVADPEELRAMIEGMVEEAIAKAFNRLAGNMGGSRE